MIYTASELSFMLYIASSCPPLEGGAIIHLEFGTDLTDEPSWACCGALKGMEKIESRLKRLKHLSESPMVSYALLRASQTVLVSHALPEIETSILRRTAPPRKTRSLRPSDLLKRRCGLLQPDIDQRLHGDLEKHGERV